MESWRNRKTLILSLSDMIGLLTPEEYNGCVEQAFRMFGEGRVYMEPKGHIVLDRYPGEWKDHGPPTSRSPSRLRASGSRSGLGTVGLSMTCLLCSQSLSIRTRRPGFRLRSATVHITRTCARGPRRQCRHLSWHARTRACSRSWRPEIPLVGP